MGSKIYTVPNNVIFCIWPITLLPGTFSRYSFTPFLITPGAPIISDIVLVLISYILDTSISSCLYLESFSNYFVDTFLSDGMVISIKVQCLVVWSLIIISGLLWLGALSVLIGISQRIVTISFSSAFLVGVHKFLLVSML